MSSWGIYDLQTKNLREERYDSKFEALKEFGDYWKHINFESDFDSYGDGTNDFEKLSTDEQKKLVEDWQLAISDEDYLSICGFLVMKL